MLDTVQIMLQSSVHDKHRADNVYSIQCNDTVQMLQYSVQ